jgi:NAD-dependent SIR2 family protein deacetylase
MIARLSQLVEQAQPTPFHQMLKALDDRNQLLRCYTQNIDCIEEKAGLSLGVPSPQIQRRSPKKPKRLSSTVGINSLSPSPSPSPSPLGAPAVDETPKCIPLHGTLKTLHCHTCGATTSLADKASSFEDGSAPACLQCSEFEHTRQLVGKRLRGVGVMRPSIVLYNEDHREGERVGDIVKRDLTGGRTKRAPPDLLLVAGTSLRVPGTKRIVKEFSKAARSGVGSGESLPSTPSGSSTRPSPSAHEVDERPIRSIYLNLDFPMPAREWESTFDLWVQGDVQEFVRKVRQAIQKQDEVKRAKEDRAVLRMAGEKRKREAEEQDEGESLDSAVGAPSISSKRRRLAPVIGRKESHTTTDTTASSGFRTQVDVFGPVVLPVHPTSERRLSSPEIHASVSCGMQRSPMGAMGYRTYPLGSITRDPPMLSSGTVIGEHGQYSDASVAIERY